MISIKFLSPTTWKRLLEISAVFRSLTRRSMRSQWIDTAVQAGVNDVSSIYFSLSHAKSVAVKNDLLKQAVTNAKSKANIAASALGLNVIGVKSINIESTNGFPPSPPEPFITAAQTAQNQIANGTVLGGHIGVTQGYLTYTYFVANPTNDTAHIVIIDAGNGQVLYTSEGKQIGSWGQLSMFGPFGQEKGHEGFGGSRGFGPFGYGFGPFHGGGGFGPFEGFWHGFWHNK